jgi:hypothetical protein
MCRWKQGKQRERGKLAGDVHLFGFVQRPTVGERYTHLTRKTDVITSTTDTVENIIHQQVEKVNMSDKQVTDLFEPFIQIIALLGNRLKDLRECKLSKMKALDQFQQPGSQEGKQDWRTSKFVYDIRVMQTYVFQLNDCIRVTLHCVDLHGSVIAALNCVPHLYTETKVILLGEQENYVCLNGQALAENSDSRYVAQ